MQPRPRLRFAYPPLRRSSDSLQLGLTADDAVVLSGLDGGEAALLESLDGRHTLTELYAVAARLQVRPARVDALLRLLRAEGLLGPPAIASVPAARKVRRHGRYVIVGGTGVLPDAVAATLRAAGVGRVETGDWALDHAELRLRDGHGDGVAPDLVLLAAQDALDPRAGMPWRRHGVALLPVVAGSGTVAIGPLVLPDPKVPCLRCLELHRADRDHGWPHVLAQACPDSLVQRPVRCDPTLGAAAAGNAAMVVVGHLDGQPVPPGLTLELRLPLPRLDHRIWRRHPQCPDHRAKVRPAAG